MAAKDDLNLSYNADYSDLVVPKIHLKAQTQLKSQILIFSNQASQAVSASQRNLHANNSKHNISAQSMKELSSRNSRHALSNSHNRIFLQNSENVKEIMDLILIEGLSKAVRSKVEIAVSQG